jgi:DNA-binding transcriptional regulator YhcF (GntR family)
VANVNPNLAMEEKQKEVEKLFEQGIRKAKECGMSVEDTKELFQVVLSDFE